MGGHSGLNIGEGRGNAVVFAARAADAVLSGVPGARLAAIVGGDKRNAIPREASATLTVPAGAAHVAGTVVSTSENHPNLHPVKGICHAHCAGKCNMWLDGAGGPCQLHDR